MWHEFFFFNHLSMFYSNTRHKNHTKIENPVWKEVLKFAKGTSKSVFTTVQPPSKPTLSLLGSPGCWSLSLLWLDEGHVASSSQNCIYYSHKCQQVLYDRVSWLFSVFLLLSVLLQTAQTSAQTMMLSLSRGWPLMSCSGRVPGRVHMAWARCPNTVASNVEILEPIKYFLSPLEKTKQKNVDAETRTKEASFKAVH